MINKQFLARPLVGTSLQTRAASIAVSASVFVASFISLTNSIQAALIGFEDLTLATNSYNNGGPSTNSSGFVTEGTRFSNTYDATSDSWEGFSYSNTSDTTTAGYTNQYSAITGSGVGGSGIYGVAYAGYATPPRITLATGLNTPQSIQITNTTYAYISMRDGDFAKKFGGPSGNDPDLFTLTISGFDAANNLLGNVDFILADYRFTDNSRDYIVNTWTTVDLTPLGTNVSALEFSWTSTDNDPVYGINTPTYAAVDNLVAVPEPAPFTLLGLVFFGWGFSLVAGSRQKAVR